MKEGKELLKQKAGLAQEQIVINWSLINIVRKLEDVFQPPEQYGSGTGFQQQRSERGLGSHGAWAVSGRDGVSRDQGTEFRAPGDP